MYGGMRYRNCKWDSEWNLQVRYRNDRGNLYFKLKKPASENQIRLTVSVPVIYQIRFTILPILDMYICFLNGKKSTVFLPYSTQ